MDSPQGSDPIDSATPGPRRFPWAGVWRWSKRIGKWSLRGLVGFLIVVSFLIGYGTPASDAEKMRQFADAVARWQHDPDFREVQIEYCEKGSDAMRTRVCFTTGTNAIMFLRSLPGLPAELAVNPTSLEHYNSFSRGPLSSYLRLTSEQGLGNTLGSLNYLANKSDLNDDDLRKFLAGYVMPRPVVKDAGALASIRKLMKDVGAEKKFTLDDVEKQLIMDDVEKKKITSDQAKKKLSADDSVMDEMFPRISAVAEELGVPTNPADMTVAQQVAVWKNLDAHVLKYRPELWRRKQVNDWLNGIWAQVYGPMYSDAIYPVLTVRAITKVAAPLMLMGWVGLALWRRKRAADLARPVETEMGEPRLALEGGEEIGE